jgi:hypothetical protein
LRKAAHPRRSICVQARGHRVTFPAHSSGESVDGANGSVSDRVKESREADDSLRVSCGTGSGALSLTHTNTSREEESSTGVNQAGVGGHSLTLAHGVGICPELSDGPALGQARRPYRACRRVLFGDALLSCGEADAATSLA